MYYAIGAPLPSLHSVYGLCNTYLILMTHAIQLILLPVLFNGHCSNDESSGTKCYTNNANYNTNNDRCCVRHAGLASSIQHTYKQMMHLSSLCICLHVVNIQLQV